MVAIPTKPPAKVSLKSMTCCVVDQGLFCELAVKLAESYGKVYYWVPSYSGFKKITKAMIGYGMPGIELIDDIFQVPIDEVDIYIFPDVYFGWLQTHLRSLGKLVWGAGQGEKMELDRGWMKDEMKKLGLPVGPWARVKGMDALRKYLKENKDQYVKVSEFRGVTETFHAPHYQYVEPKLNELEHELGPLGDITEFIVEASLPDKIEMGIDAYTVDGLYPDHILAGLEIKDVGYAGIFKAMAQFPAPLINFNAKIAPMLKSFGYRGPMSTEVRFGKPDKTMGYMVDFCARQASPPSELYMEFYENLAMIQYMGAAGTMVQPKPIAKYGAQALIHSSWSSTHFQPIDIPAEYKGYVKLKNPCLIDGKYYTIPQNDDLVQCGAVIGFGDTLEDAFEMVREIAKSVKGHYIDIKTDSFEDVEKVIEEADSYGIRIF
jgi:hypothetical protein